MYEKLIEALREEVRSLHGEGYGLSDAGDVPRRFVDALEQIADRLEKAEESTGDSCSPPVASDCAPMPGWHTATFQGGEWKFLPATFPDGSTFHVPSLGGESLQVTATVSKGVPEPSEDETTRKILVKWGHHPGQQQWMTFASLQVADVPLDGWLERSSLPGLPARYSVMNAEGECEIMDWEMPGRVTAGKGATEPAGVTSTEDHMRIAGMRSAVDLTPTGGEGGRNIVSADSLLQEPTDDDEPLTADWMRAVMPDGRIDHGHQCLRWCAAPGGDALFISCGIKDGWTTNWQLNVRTRGDYRELRRLLGVPLEGG